MPKTIRETALEMIPLPPAFNGTAEADLEGVKGDRPDPRVDCRPVWQSWTITGGGEEFPEA